MKLDLTNPKNVNVSFEELQLKGSLTADICGPASLAQGALNVKLTSLLINITKKGNSYNVDFGVNGMLSLTYDKACPPLTVECSAKMDDKQEVKLEATLKSWKNAFGVNGLDLSNVTIDSTIGPKMVVTLSADITIAGEKYSLKGEAGPIFALILDMKQFSLQDVCNLATK